MDAFIELSSDKEFKDITVKDIATEAMINRATFYYHFEDIYDLLEKVLSEVLLINLDCSYYDNNELNDEVIVNTFLAITNFQKSLSNRCHRGYEDTIARIIDRKSTRLNSSHVAISYAVFCLKKKKKNKTIKII